MRGPGIVTTRKEVIPFHLCLIKEGQLYKKKDIPPDVTAQMLNLSKMPPRKRLELLQAGMSVRNTRKTEVVSRTDPE